METRDASPAHFLIRIESFPLLSKYGIKEYESREFVAGDYKWKIELYPNGDTREKGRSVSIFLHCVDSKSFAASVKTTNSGTSPPVASHSRKTSHWFTSSATDWGWPAFIPIADMRKGFIVDDCCLLEIEVSVRAVVNPPSTSD
ncbi:hypothetical protein DH2020_049490 [Rehmannia glutinosa]|uniref:MATH domain-containing protein n=1 Tax=Rehmannia glutinosa TaxID=99300 RepID=A0ABR0U3C8_REHGL